MRLSAPSRGSTCPHPGRPVQPRLYKKQAFLALPPDVRALLDSQDRRAKAVFSTGMTEPSPLADDDLMLASIGESGIVVLPCFERRR